MTEKGLFNGLSRLAELGKAKRERSLGKRERQEYDKLLAQTKRKALKIGVSLGGAIGLAVVVDNLIETDQESVESYTNAFKDLSRGDQEAEAMYAFLTSQGRISRMENGGVQVPDGIDPNNNFLIVVVNARSNPGVFTSDQAIGAAAFKNTVTPPQLILKKVKLSPLWKGALLAHETIHAYQWITQIEQSRPDGFLQGEVDAYSFEFRLIDRAVSGRFNEALQLMIPTVEPNTFRGDLGERDWAAINYAFGYSQNTNDDDIKAAAYTIALNFRVAETVTSTPEDAETLKKQYLQAVFEGIIPVRGLELNTRLKVV